MRIGELAGLAGLTVKTLRFYEQAGVLEPPPRHTSGYRDYDATALPRLRFVKAAQAAGLTLAEIRQVISVREQTGAPCLHVAALLETHLTALDRRLAELTALRAEVQRLRRRADRLDPASCSAASVCQVIPSGAGSP